MYTFLKRKISILMYFYTFDVNKTNYIFLNMCRKQLYKYIMINNEKYEKVFIEL